MGSSKLNETVEKAVWSYMSPRMFGFDTVFQTQQQWDLDSRIL